MMYLKKENNEFAIKCYFDPDCSPKDARYLDKAYISSSDSISYPRFTMLLENAKIYKNMKRAENVAKDIVDFYANIIGGVYEAKVIEITKIFNEV